jgi:hypothetical protein
MREQLHSDVRAQIIYYTALFIALACVLPLRDLVRKGSYLHLCSIKFRLKIVSFRLSYLAIRLQRLRLLAKGRKLSSKCRYRLRIANIQIKSINQRFQAFVHSFWHSVKLATGVHKIHTEAEATPGDFI